MGWSERQGPAGAATGRGVKERARDLPPGLASFAMADDAAPQPEFNPQVMIQPEQMAGAWANFARVSHSPFEFTVDFIRLDFSNSPPSGIVVSRISLSPLFVSQLITVLSDQWTKYAEKTFPPEARDVTDDPQTDPGNPGPPA